MELNFSDPKWACLLQGKNLDKFSDEELIAAIKHDPFIWTMMKNPKEEWTNAAIEKNPHLIAFVDYPTVHQQRLAAKNLSAIKHIINIDETLALELIHQDPHAINYMCNPPSIVLSAVKIIS